MKITVTFLAFLGVFTLGAAAPPAPVPEGELPVFRATPGTMPDLPEQAAVWIPGGDPAESNIGKQKVENSFSGTILRKLESKPETGNFQAVYRFEIPLEAEFDFFAALVNQGQPYASPVEFRFDDEPFYTVRPSAAVRPAWGVSSAMRWDFLGRRKLAAGTHSLTFRFDRKAQLGSWSFMCDGVIGLERNAWQKARITPPVRKSFDGGTLHYTHSGPAFPAVLRLAFGGETVVSRSFFSREGENTVELELPERLGRERWRYTVELVPLDDPAHRFFSLPVTFVTVSPNQPAVLTGAELKGGSYNLTFKGKKRVPVLAMFFYEDKLYRVVRLDDVKGSLPEELLKQLAGRKWHVRFQMLPAPADGRPVEMTVSFPGKAAALSKPVNYGFFTDGEETVHTWYMSHDYEYIFDGRRYFPAGGMWCSDTLISREADVARINANLKKDLGTIRAIKAGGLDDVYLNLSTQAPLGVRQAFIDMLAEEDIYYGYQLNGGGGARIPSFFITMDRENPPGNYRGLTRGVYAGGTVTARFPKEQKLLGLLLYFPGAEKANFLNFSDREGKDTRHGIIDLEKEQDFGKLREISFRIKLELPEKSEVILIPLLEGNMHHANLWDEADFSKVKEKVSWIGKISWNKNLRFFVDPIRNETNMVNGTENLRQYTPPINRAFAAYLEKRYGALERMKKAWALPVVSFEQAARLIPLRLEKKVCWIDPVTGDVLTGGLTDSFAWIDYQEMIRVTYADLADEIAVYIKSLVNVPVVFKSVGVIGETMSVSRRYLGYDGVGFECYLNQGTPGETGGGASRAEAEASSHTMWKVGTEVGHSAAVGNGGTRFFKDEAEIRGMAVNLSRLGVQGFYFFGFDLKPGNLWKNHNYHDFPEGLAWAARIDRESNAGSPAPTPANYVFPGGYTWWWWTTRYKALYGHEQNMIPQSARLGENALEWFSSTNVLPERFDAVIINCPYPPFSRYHAADISRAVRSGQRVYYVGHRSDLGAIPELDGFFTEEKIAFGDNSTAQVLKGGKVLAAENGKPWAVSKGNLVIVSRVPDELPKNRADGYLHYLTRIVESIK